MKQDERLSESEFKQMIHLLNRYINTDMDQFELWKLKTENCGEVYITISMAKDGPDSAYQDLTRFIE